MYFGGHNRPFHVMSVSESYVVSGKQITYSLYFKWLLALACDMRIDECSARQLIEDNNCQELVWFEKFCVAYRTAKTLTHNTTLPVDVKMEIARQLHTLDVGCFLCFVVGVFKFVHFLF